jgi:hypothetical protein
MSEGMASQGIKPQQYGIHHQDQASYPKSKFALIDEGSHCICAQYQQVKKCYVQGISMQILKDQQEGFSLVVFLWYCTNRTGRWRPGKSLIISTPIVITGKSEQSGKD